MPVTVSELDGESLRLICMGKGYLMPDTRTLEDCQVPVFKTHPTPINVSIKPPSKAGNEDDKTAKKNRSTSDGTVGASGDSASSLIVGAGGSSTAARQGCCVIL